MRWKSESGKGRAGLFLAIALVVAGIFCAMKFIPVRIAAYEFQDFVEQECRHAAARRGDIEVKQRILDKAKELEIPLEAKRLRVKRTKKEMIISAAYEQPIDLKLTTYVYKVDFQRRAPLF